MEKSSKFLKISKLNNQDKINEVKTNNLIDLTTISKKRERQRKMTNTVVELSRKTQKITYDIQEDIEIPDDLIFDSSSDEESLNELKKRKLDDLPKKTENSGLKNCNNGTMKSKIVSKKDNRIPTEPKSVKHIDKNDIILPDDIFAQFSDDDSETSFLSIPKSISVLSKISEKTTDSGIITLGAENDEDYTDLFDDWDEEKKYCLDLEDFKRVRVIKIDRKKTVTELTVEDLHSPASAIVFCSELWRDVKISINEIVTIKAKKTLGTSDWIVNNEHGFFVANPDFLVTGTEVVNSFFCQRKGVFQSKFTGINCLPNVEPTDACLTLGTIVHELLQTALSQNIFETKDLWDCFERLLKNPTIVLMLYSSRLNHKQIKKLTTEYVEMIHNFMTRYIQGIHPQVPDQNFMGKIIAVKDIEESVCLPKLGLKGKIDATVEVKMHGKFGGTRIMPLEIKTGKASFSVAHKGQLYLYCIMLNILGTKVDSGLLLYIKDNLMQEIKAGRHEERDLIMLRNSLVYYLSKEPMPKVSESIGDDRNAIWESMELPDPIYHSTVCNNCVYNTICCVYADKDINLSLSDNHPVKQLSNELLKDLKVSHIDYVINWIAMLEMEQAFERDAASSRRIWESKPIYREKRRLCLSYLEVQDVKTVREGVLHHFTRSKNLDKIKKKNMQYLTDNFNEVFVEDDLVMINTDTRIHLASGYVQEITNDEIKISLEKDITKWNCSGTFHVDLYPQVNRTKRVMGTVITLLTDNDITRRLRNIIIDKEPATFNSEIPKIYHSEKSKEIRSGLNKFQEVALKAVIEADDYVLIKGMPGTGKTHLIVALIELLVLMGKSVLVTAHTNTAVNNIMLKLVVKNINFLRVGMSAKIHPLLLEKCDTFLIKECETPEMLENKFSKINVVGVTCLGTGNALLSNRMFDYCIVDECSQALQPILLRPLFNAMKFVLIGDPEQLPAVVRCNEARKFGMDEDIFSRLDSTNNTRALCLQYRMNLSIMNLANELTYKGELQAGNESVAKATLTLRNLDVVSKSEKWVQKTFSCKLEDSVIMLNTGSTYFRNTWNQNMKNEKKTNECENTKKKDEDYDVQKSFEQDDNEIMQCSSISEASIVFKLVDILIKSGVKTEDIGIIAPYRAQTNLLRRVIKHEIEINTVDQYQGRDKPVILLSFAKSSPLQSCTRTNEYEILEDHKRLNVALTRAKHKLIIIGDVSSLQKYTPLKKMFNIIKKDVINLNNGIDGFSWENLLSNVSEKPK